MEDRDLEKLRDISSRVSEFFPDHLLVVRTEDSFCWKFSDATWAVGAADRFAASIKDEDMLNKLRALNGEE